MQYLTSKHAHVKDMWDTLRAVHARVVAIDKTYVYYRWWETCVNVVQRLGFVIMIAVFAQAVVTNLKPSWTFVLAGLGAYAVVMSIVLVTEVYMRERGKYFRMRLEE
jgi:hypothetical protein